MILTDYYKMQEIKPLKSHRFDCVASTGEYEPFEKIAQRARAKRLHFYYVDVPDSFTLNAKRKTDKMISNIENISSVYIPYLESPLYGYGDTKGTTDALLFLFSEDYKQLEVFVARGYKNNQQQVFHQFLEGDFDAEINILRERAKATNIGAE